MNITCVCIQAFLAEKKTADNVVIPDEYIRVKVGERFTLESCTEDYNMLKGIDSDKIIFVTPYDFYACFDKENDPWNVTENSIPRLANRMPDDLYMELFFEDYVPEEDDEEELDVDSITDPFLKHLVQIPGFFDSDHEIA